MIQRKYYKMVRVSYADSDLFQINNITNETGVITVNNQYNNGTLQYSTDGVNFTTAVFTHYTCEIELPAGGNCYFKGTNFYRHDSNSYVAMFDCSVNHKVKGNLYSLVDPTNYVSATTLDRYMFFRLLYNNTHLIDAGGLTLPVGVTHIEFYCLFYAFAGCTSLTTAPDLSGVTSIGECGLYYSFKDCTSLTTAPDLSSVTSLGSSALYEAFGGCTSLTTAPDLSSVTSLGSSALYRVVFGCSNIQTIYVPNVTTWETNKFSQWVFNAGSSAATPRQMIFQSQALMDACPSGESGYGVYTKVLA